MLRAVLAMTLLLGCRTKEVEATDAVVAAESAALLLPQPAASASASSAPPAKAITDCSLRAELEIRRKGQFNLAKLILINEGQRPLRLMLPGDGSVHGLPRTPKLTWFYSQDGVPVHERGGPSCAYQNDAKPADFFTLEPKAKRVIEDWLGGLDLVPGRYDIQLRYEHSPDKYVPASGNAEVEALLQLTDACSVTSNSVSFTIR
jgi:hypothetical protein